MLRLATVRMSPDKQIVPFQPNHLDRIELKGFELDYVRTIPNYKDYIIYNAEHDLTWTGISRGKVILIFGIRPLWPRVAEAWMMPGKGIEDNAVSVLRGARQVLDNVIEDYDMMRLHIAVRVQNETAYKFAKALYFEEEAVMKRYGPEMADYYLMARLSNGGSIR